MAAYIFRDSLSKPRLRVDLLRPIDALKLYPQDRWASLSIIGEAGIKSVKEGFNPSEFEIFHNRAQMLREQDFIVYEREGFIAIPAWVLWAGVALSVATSIYSIVRANKMKAPSNLNRTQESATNRIQERTNDPRVDQRVENNYGQVRNFFTQMSKPYIVCENNQQVEYSYMSAGQGRYDIDDVRDNRTLGSQLTSWSMKAYRPFESPNNAEAYHIIGSDFDRKIFTTFECTDLTGGELYPPNSLQISTEWIINYSNGVAEFKSYNEKIDMRDYFTVGDNVDMSDVAGVYGIGTVDIAKESGGIYVKKSAEKYHVEVFGSGMIVKSVSELVVLFDVPLDKRDLFSKLKADYIPWNVISKISGGEYIWKNDADEYQWYWISDSQHGDELNPVDEYYDDKIIPAFSGVVGPFQVDATASHIQFNLYSNGLYYDKGNNDISKLSVDGVITIRETTKDGIATGNVTQKRWELTTNSNNFRARVCKSFDVSNPYEYCTAEIVRTKNRDFSFSGNVVDIVEVTELYFHRDDYRAHFGDKTTLQFRRTQATYGVGKASKVSALTTSELSINGAWTATRYFDDIICDAAADPVFGRRSAAAVAEMRTNLRSARDQLIDYFGREDVAYFDYCIDSENITFESFVRQVANAVFCTAYLKQNLRFAPDVYQPIDTAIFGHGNKLIADESLKYSFDDLQGKKYDCVEVKWRNPDNMDAQEVIYIPDQGSNPKTIDLSGVRNERNATIHGWREWYRITSQRYSYECTVGLEGTQLIPNQRIGIVNNCCGESFDGSFVAWDSGVNVRFSQKADLSAGGYRIVIQSPNGGVGVFGVTQGVDLYHGVLSETPTFTINTNLKENLTVYRIAKEDDLITESYALSEPELTDKGIKLKAVNYAPIIYSKDLTI